MKCKEMNKFLLLFALLLVVGVSLIGISSAAIIYVPDNYASIQEAIDAASAGDTVMVRNGAYSENVVLNKSLSLIGEDLPTVDAQQNGSAIEITADSCVVNGFRCVNAKYPRNAGISVLESNSNFIENITCCEKNNIGILLMDSSNNTISNNEIYENCNNGIELRDSSNNTISNNKIYENCNNGIASDRSSNNRIMNNEIHENNYDGIALWWGSSNNMITNNTLDGNDCGINLDESLNNWIINNKIVENNYHGISLGWDTSNNRISNNTCHKNNRDGLCLRRDSSNNTITNNSFKNNGNGIVLWASYFNTIFNNEIYENYQTGIDLWDSSNNLIYLNDFVKNTDNVYSDNSDNFWVSMSKITYVYNEKEYESHLGNYWDDYTGQDEDGNGIGETPYDIYAPLWGIDEDGSYDYCPLVQSFKNYCRK